MRERRQSPAWLDWQHWSKSLLQQTIKKIVTIGRHAVSADFSLDGAYRHLMPNLARLSPMLNRPKPLKYWPRNLLLVAILLLVWLLVSLMPVGLPALPDDWTIFGWPLSMALAAFGVPLIYLGLIGVYAAIMDRRDKQETQALAKQAVADDPPQS
jgi:putative solute:sodium symporter small subunit